MAAITVTLVTIADAAVDPESPVDTTLVTGLRDNIEYVVQWLGHSFRGAAVQDHNHDGTNSAKLPIGSNSVRNGSFEDGGGSTTGWTLTNFTGGSNAINSANEADGQKCLAITSTVLANGGGQADSNEFDPVTGDAAYSFKLTTKASVAGVSSKSEVVWFDDAQAQISVSTIHSDTSTPTVSKQRGGIIRAPASARFCKIRLTGGVPSSGSATGTVYFDGVSKSDGPPLLEPGTTTTIISNDAETTTNSTSAVKMREFYVGMDGIVRVEWEGKSDSGGDSAHQVRVNGSAATLRDGSASTEHSTSGTAYQSFNDEVMVRAGDLLQLYTRHGTGGASTAFVRNVRVKTASIVPYFFNTL